jgi:hypothetical protein
MGLLRPRLFPFGKLSKAKPAAQVLIHNNGKFKTLSLPTIVTKKLKGRVRDEHSLCI